MESFFIRYRNLLVLLAILVAQIIGLAVQVRQTGAGHTTLDTPDGSSVRLIRMWAMTAVTPLERVTHAIGSGTGRAWSAYIDLRHVRQQNKDLQQQLARVRIEEAAIAEDALQGRRLQAMLGFRESYVGSTVAAQVIGASGSEQSHILTIDKGTRDGLRPDMAVITQNGVVGKLRDVFPTTAEVLEINDQSSGAGVLLASTRIRAILRGTLTGRVQIGNLTADSRIQPGEQVLTSGGDQVYPRGLQVGVVESIAPDPDHQPYTAIRVKTAVDLDRVEEVLVITGTQPDLTAGAQQDLTAAAAQHAADLSAERLPGIYDEQTPGATGASGATAATGAATPPAVNATPALPHPLPVVHPDRFSSGSTAPASDLKPGGANSAPSGQQPQPPQPGAAQ